MKKFSKSFSGYNTREVNAFVNDVVTNVDEMLHKMKEKDMEIDRLNKELEHYKSMDATLNRAIVMAEESSKKYQQSSISESDLIVTEAKRNANRIINDALMKAEKANNDAERLKRNVDTLKKRLRQIIESQLEVIEEMDRIDIKDEY